MSGKRRTGVALRGARWCGVFVAALTALAFAGLALGDSALGAPGQLDRSFGANGVAVTELGSHYGATRFYSVAAQPDGSVLAAREGTLRHYLANGALDPAYAPQPTPPADEAERRAQLPSGKTLVVKSEAYTYTKTSASFEIVVRRLNPDGSPDAGFGKGGVVRLFSDFGFVENFPRGIIATADEGAVVIAGSALVGLTASGALDPAYGSGGIAKVDGGITAFHAQPDGKLLLTGERGCCQESSDFFVARYTTQGAPDPSFGAAAGSTVADFGGSDHVASALWASDGSIVVGGSSITAPDPAIPSDCLGLMLCTEVPVLARFGADGRLDPGFGSGGLVRLAPLAAGSNSRLGVSSAGEMGVLTIAARAAGGWIAGGSGGPAQTVAFLAALGTDGALDLSFGDGGIVSERHPSPSAQEAQVTAVAPDGSILVAGFDNAGTSGGPAALRYRPDGTLDTSFGQGGSARLPGVYGTASLAVDPSGRVIALLRFGAVARLTASGALDRSFGEAGTVALPGTPLSALVLPDGDLVLGGTREARHGQPNRMMAIRLNADGSRDRGFGHNGIATAPCPGKGDCEALSVGRDSHGRVLLAGAMHGRLALARLLPDGRPDRGFGRTGLVVPRLAKHSKATAVTARGGKILLGGQGSRGGRITELLLRLDGSGRLDRGFAKGGIARVALPGRAAPSAIIPTRDRLVVVSSGAGRPAFGFGFDGRRDRGSKVAVDRVTPASGAAQQGKVVLAWTVERADKVRQIALGRLTDR